MNALIENAKNVVFDVGQVLLRFAPKEFLPKMFPPDIAEKLMPPALFGDDLWLRMDRGDFSAAEAARLITEKAGHPELQPYELEFMHQFARLMTLLPPALLVPELKKMGKRLYIISNYGVETFAATQAQFPQLFSQFDGMVISAHEKLIKPDIRIYQLLCDRYSLNPEECVFIDDLEANVQGAVRAGFKGIHYTGPEAIE